MFYYHAYGLIIASEIELPELAESDRITPHIAIANGSLSVSFDEPATAGFSCKVVDDGAFLNWSMIGTFFVSVCGSRVICDIPADVDPAWVRLALLGPIIPVALYSRGYLVLHAGASLVGQNACIFIGSGGSGKSTTVAALQLRGHRSLCDDTVAIFFDSDDNVTPRIYSGIPRLKLWPDSVKSTGLADADSQPIYNGHAKLSVAVGKSELSQQQSYKVSNIFCLNIADQLSVQPMARTEALLNVLGNSYVGMMNKRLAAKGVAREFEQAGRLLNHVDIARLNRPPDLGLLPEIAQLAEEYVNGLTPKSAFEKLSYDPT